MSPEEGKEVIVEYNKIKAERDTLIEDIAVLKANISRLEWENRNLINENKAILSQSDSYFDEWQNEQTTSQGLREQCKEYAQDANKYLCLTDHIRLKAQAFDNYMADLEKTMEEYPDNYIKSDNFAKETYEFYMKSKKDFIKAYENEVGRKHELIHDIAEYDRLLSDLEDK